MKRPAKPTTKKKTPKTAPKAKRVLGNKARAKATTSYPKPIADVGALPPLDPNRLLKPQEAADRLTVSLSTLRRLIKDGRLPVVRVGHAIRIRPADLEAFVTPTATNE